MTDTGQNWYWWVPISAALISAIAGIVTVVISRGDGGGNGPGPTSLPGQTGTMGETTVPPPPAGKAAAYDLDDILSDAQGRRFGPTRPAGGTPATWSDPMPAGSPPSPAKAARAIQFPRPCPEVDTGGCDAAVTDVAHADDLNPIDGDFAYGARLRLRPEEKVPGEGGRPTCILIVGGSSGRHPAISTIDIADGEWHTVDCTRRGTILTVHSTR